MKYFAFVISLTICCLSFGQTAKIDSLQKELLTEEDDSVRFYLYQYLADEVFYIDVKWYANVWRNAIADLDHEYEDERIAKFIRYNLPVAHINIGYYYEVIGKPDSALYHYYIVADKAMHNHDLYLLANVYNNLGSVYTDQGNYPLGLKNYWNCYHANVVISNYHGQAISKNNIGYIYSEQQMYGDAINYFRESLSIKKQIGDFQGIGYSLNNIGKAYKNLGVFDSAKYYMTQAYNTWDSLGYTRGIATVSINLGNLYFDQNIDSAQSYYLSALSYADSSRDLSLKVQALIDLSRIALIQSNSSKALDQALLAEELALEIGYPILIQYVSDVLDEIYVSQGDWQKAYKQKNRYYQMRDSLLNDRNKQDLITAKIQGEYEKKELADSLRRQEQNRLTEVQHQQEIKTQKTFLYVGFGALVVAVIVIIIVYRSYKNKKRDNVIIAQQKQKVEEQKLQIEEAHEEITDSISYAKRIQHAILPPPEFWDQHLKDSFVLYLPKDIVAGDFYWIEVIDNDVYFAAADCTGHGVPGAMVSVVCNNALNRAVREFNLKQPGKILDKVTDLVLETFEKSTESVKDGMDIALCKLSGDTLAFAGAHNPLWLVRKGNFENETPNISHDSLKLFEFKANKQPVGQYEHRSAFETTTITLKKGDIIYLSSDGYPDQFGGEKAKKLKSKGFKKLLLSIAQQPIPDQKRELNTHFHSWKGNLEQLDDVCVIGVKI